MSIERLVGTGFSEGAGLRSPRTGRLQRPALCQLCDDVSAVHELGAIGSGSVRETSSSADRVFHDRSVCLAGLAGPITGDMNLRLIAVVGYGVAFPAACVVLALLLHDWTLDPTRRTKVSS